PEQGTPGAHSPPRAERRHGMGRVALTGLLIWAGATLALRLGGGYIFGSRSNLAAILLLIASMPLMIVVAIAVLGRFHDRGPRAIPAIALAAPGIPLAPGSTIASPSVSPTPRPAAAGLLGGWLLFCNVPAPPPPRALGGRNPAPPPRR